MFVVVLYYIIFAITLIFGLYFVFTGVIGLIKKKNDPEPIKNKDHNFAILIAARNEGMVIGNLLDSLKKQNYPAEKYEIYVIPNNCTDNTEEICKEHEVNIIKCQTKPKSKGEVLKIAFAKLKKNKKIDAYLIFDADNIVHPDFLIHMNRALNQGYNVAEGFRDAKNPGDNWISGSYTLFYLFQNVFFNEARMGLNGSASINGTGFMVRKSLIDEKGFKTKTLTEDMEYTGICALNNERIAFVKDAITYDEHPINFKTSWHQRIRWSAGILKCMWLYCFKLIKNFFKTGNIASLDVALMYMGPLMQVLSFVDLVMLIIFQICGIKLNDIFSYFFAAGWFYFIVTYLIGILVEIWLLHFKNKKAGTVIQGIILFPIFVFTWIPINIFCLLKRKIGWEEIKHNRDVKISEVVK